MLGLFATICIFTILHSSEQFVTARNIAIFRGDLCEWLYVHMVLRGNEESITVSSIDGLEIVLEGR